MCSFSLYLSGCTQSSDTMQIFLLLLLKWLSVGVFRIKEITHYTHITTSMRFLWISLELSVENCYPVIIQMSVKQVFSDTAALNSV